MRAPTAAFSGLGSVEQPVRLLNELFETSNHFVECRHRSPLFLRP